MALIIIGNWYGLLLVGWFLTFVKIGAGSNNVILLVVTSSSNRLQQ